MYVPKCHVKVSTVIILSDAVVLDLLLRSTKRCISYQYADIAVITGVITSNVKLDCRGMDMRQLL